MSRSRASIVRRRTGGGGGLLTPARVHGAGGNDGITAGSFTTSFTIPAVGVTVGQVAVVGIETQNATVLMSSVPAGVNLRSGPDRQTTLGTAWMYTKTLEAADLGATWDFTMDTLLRPTGTLDIYSNCTETGLVIGPPTADPSASTTATLPVAAGVPAGALVHAWFGRRVANPPAVDVPFPAGYSAGARAASDLGTGVQTSSESGHKIAATSGSYGGETATVTSSSGGGYLLALPALPA